jgi:hypothetical protein
MARVFKFSRSKNTARLVLLALADVANDDGEVTAYGRSHKVLARKANCDEGTVSRAISTLVDLGEVERVKVGDGRSSSDYLLHIPEGGQIEGGQIATPAPADRAPTPRDLPPQGARDAPPISPSSSVEPPSSSALPGMEGAEASAPSPYTFDLFWSIYPRKVAKADALKAWTAAAKSIDPGRIVAGADRYAAHRANVARQRGQAEAVQYTKHPAAWLRAGMWDDELPAPDRGRDRGVDTDRAAPSGRMADDEV